MALRGRQVAPNSFGENDGVWEEGRRTPTRQPCSLLSRHLWRLRPQIFYEIRVVSHRKETWETESNYPHRSCHCHTSFVNYGSPCASFDFQSAPEAAPVALLADSP